MDVIDPRIEQYVERLSSPHEDLLAELSAETADVLGMTQMLTGPVAGRFLELLVWFGRPQRVLEIGTFSGHSALAMAAALPEGGRIDACELDPERAAFAQRYFDRSPHGSKITLHVGPALETVNRLEGEFDLVFIDAEKEGYVGYYEAVLPRLTERGLIVADNTLAGGRVVEGERPDIADFNEHVAADPRSVQVVLSVRDGMTADPPRVGLVPGAVRRRRFSERLGQEADEMRSRAVVMVVLGVLLIALVRRVRKQEVIDRHDDDRGIGPGLGLRIGIRLGIGIGLRLRLGIGLRPSFASTKNCKELEGLAAKVSQSFQPNANGELDLSKEADALDALANAAPDDIKGDFKTFADAFKKFAKAYGDVKLKPGETPSAAQIAKLAAGVEVVQHGEAPAGDRSTWPPGAARTAASPRRAS